MTFTAGMRRTTAEELRRITQELFKWGQRLSHTPFGSFTGAKDHRVGRLKVWPELKAFKPELETWEELKWKPLNPYHKHYWRNMFALRSRWCIHVITTLQLGWLQNAPRRVVKKIEDFNGRSEE